MKRLKLKELLNRAEEILKEEKYSKETIMDYKYVWNKFYNICKIRIYKF